MDITQDELALAGVQAEIAAGLILIGEQLDLLSGLDLADDSDTQERRELWSLERDQARLCRERLVVLQRIALTETGLVVLVVEDNPLVRMVAGDFLRTAGFSVIETASADEALAVLETDGSIRAVFTDVQMPGSMNGLDLARAVRERWPFIRVLITSGNLRFASDGYALGDKFIGKPYSAEQVVAGLRGD